MNQDIGVRFTIYVTAESGPEVYQETHEVTTDNFGMFTSIIGQGVQVGTNQFDSIDWGAGYHYLNVAIDKTGGTDYQDMGTQQMWSVPYALYTRYAEVAGNGISDVIDNGDGTITFNYYDGSTYTTDTLGSAPGPAGASAYDIWITQGNSGTEQDFLNSLVGPQGPQGPQGPAGNGITNVSVQNDSITIVFSDGSDTTMYIGASGGGGTPAIGSYYQGGIVFYLDGNGGGLVVSPHDLMNYSPTTEYDDAVAICNNVVYNGYSDWYLPDISELMMIYNNLGNGGFRLENYSISSAYNVRWYWSSTEVTPNSTAMGVNFDDGTQSTLGQNNDLRIRAVRAF
jgi:hypothetical protein